jgi:hypothetical protein
MVPHLFLRGPGGDALRLVRADRAAPRELGKNAGMLTAVEAAGAGGKNFVPPPLCCSIFRLI